MASGAQVDGLRFPQVEFSLANGRVEVAAAETSAAGSSPPSSPAGSEARRMTPADVGSLLQLALGTASRLDVELPGHLERRDRASRKLARASRFPLAPFLSWQVGALRSAAVASEAELRRAAAERNACRISVRFAFGARAVRAWLMVVAAFEGLGRAGAAWEVGSLPPGGPLLPVAGTDLRRETVPLGPVLSDVLDAGWPGMSFGKPSGSSLVLYPGFGLLRTGEFLASAGIPDMKLELSEPLVAEGFEPAPDATVERRVWERANKDGSPDRRYANNRSIPLVRYGYLRLSGFGLPPRGYLISSLKAAWAFESAFADYQRVLTEEARLPGDPTERRASADEMANLVALNRPLVTVPSPPQAARAHKYTLAAIVAGVCTWAVLAGPPLGGQALAWADRYLPARAALPPRDPSPASVELSIGMESGL